MKTSRIADEDSVSKEIKYIQYVHAKLIMLQISSIIVFHTFIDLL